MMAGPLVDGRLTSRAELLLFADAPLLRYIGMGKWFAAHHHWHVFAVAPAVCRHLAVTLGISLCPSITSLSKSSQARPGTFPARGDEARCQMRDHFDEPGATSWRAVCCPSTVNR
jgi:hypothetical protein